MVRFFNGFPPHRAPGGLSGFTAPAGWTGPTFVSRSVDSRHVDKEFPIRSRHTILILSAIAMLSIWKPLSGQEGGNTPAEIYGRMQAVADGTTPQEFRCKLLSPLVDAQLGSIPRDKVVFGTFPRAEMIFKKGLGFRLMVRNVDDYYVRKLGIFEDVLEKSGLLVTQGRRNTWALFSRQYELTDLGADGNGGRRVRVREREGLPGDYGIYTLGPDWTMTRTEYYEENKLRATMTLTWQPVGKFQVLSLMSLQVPGDKLLANLAIRFADYQFDGLSLAEFRGR